MDDGASSIESYVKSSWTPLNQPQSNQKIYDERMSLITKWYPKWSHQQRKQLIQLIIAQSTSVEELHTFAGMIQASVPETRVDFAHRLPRCITLYILMHLDPRSLCRCAQVSWYWNYLAENNTIWAKKCARLGWFESGPANSQEPGVWKRHYLDNIQFLQVTRPKMETIRSELERKKLAEEEKARRIAARKCRELSAKTQPWRCSNPFPSDTHTFNYLDNSLEYRSSSSRPRKTSASKASLATATPNHRGVAHAPPNYDDNDSVMSGSSGRKQDSIKASASQPVRRRSASAGRSSTARTAQQQQQVASQQNSQTQRTQPVNGGNSSSSSLFPSGGGGGSSSGRGSNKSAVQLGQTHPAGSGASRPLSSSGHTRGSAAQRDPRLPPPVPTSLTTSANQTSQANPTLPAGLQNGEDTNLSASHPPQQHTQPPKQPEKPYTQPHTQPQLQPDSARVWRVVDLEEEEEDDDVN